MVDSRIARRLRLPAFARKFVVVPRAKDEAPDVPLRVPKHYCVQCGQRQVRCWQCDLRLPIQDVRDGYHIGHCTGHGGPVVFICPHKPALTADEYRALGSQPLERPKQIAHIPESVGSMLDLQRHDTKMRALVRVGMLSFLSGFLAGVILTGACLLLLRP